MLSSFSSYTYSNPKEAPRTPKKGKGKSCDRDYLVSIVGPSFKNKNLIEALKGKELSKKHKQSLFLVWFVHNILWARDVNNNISIGLINHSKDLEAFNSYPWGYESFKRTVQYLLTSLAPKTVNLYGFPWAFMTVHPSLVSTNRELKILVFLTLRGYGVVSGGSHAAIASVKELKSKRGVIPSKRILFSFTPLEIKAKRRRKVISKAFQASKKANLQLLCPCVALSNVQCPKKSSMS
ncbi:hypothetical protein BC332_11666 [Capsicum chinense]|nr:hypothetical protein BC332_11666 [Capsicum chinense]